MKTYYNINMDSFYNDIDKLIPRMLETETFFDGVWGVRIYDKGEAAKPIIGLKEYSDFLGSINQVSPYPDSILLEFWVTIDTTGVVESVEIINNNCDKDFENMFIKKYKKLKWTPASFNGEKVRYRFLECTII